MQKKRQTSSLPGAPNASATCGAPLSGRKLVNAPSASSAARASIFPRSAATTIGGGVAGGCSRRKPLGPRSPARIGRSASTASRTFDSGFWNGISFQRSTMTFDDDPRPSTKRPSLASCRAAACCARTGMPRVNGLTIPVPSRGLVVHAAASASGVKPSAPAVSPVHRSSKPSASASSYSGRWSRRATPGNGIVNPHRTSGTSGTLRTVEELDGIAGADAHLGRPMPLPRVALPLVRWSRVSAVSPDGAEIEWNLDDSRAGAPGRLALYAGFAPAPHRDWPSDAPPRDVEVGETRGMWREAELLEAQPSLRPAVELTWHAHGWDLRLTAQGPWEPAQLVAIAASVMA